MGAKKAPKRKEVGGRKAVGGVKKVAILGGGVGAMTAAWCLSEKAREHPEGPQYDITVYQMGWRLGGKGASGRNLKPGHGFRIEEHGMHLWMGFYANAFRMLRKVYEDLDRKPEQPFPIVLPTDANQWNAAFEPIDIAFNMSDSLLDWRPWRMYFPPNDGVPGDVPRFRVPCEFLPLIPAQLRPILNKILGNLTDACDPSTSPGQKFDTAPALALTGQLISMLQQLETTATNDLGLNDHTHAAYLQTASEAHDIVGQLLLLLAPFDELVKWLTLMDMGLAITRGIIQHSLCEQGWLAIEGLNWKDWLLQNGLQKQNEWCPMIKVIYELLFAFHDGYADIEHADLSATWGTIGLLRMVFEYQGHFYWKMNAGMGDIIFAPLYLVLKKRGVKFEFFHQVRELIPCEPDCPKHGKRDKERCIAKVRIGVQAKARQGQYQPLVDVMVDKPGVTEPLPCWPATPLYDQLVDGESMERLHIDFESYDNPWPYAEEKVLRADHDYDWVVYGMSLGSVQYVCPFYKHDRRWKDMVENVGTVRTQAFQLWLTRNVEQLGWAPAVDGTSLNQRALTGGFVEPLDTWGNWTQVLAAEDWPPGLVNSIQYFCGPARDGITREIVLKNALRLMRFDYHWMWPNAYDDIGEFKWEYLVDPHDQTGVARFRSQFFRANTEPSELYVQSFAGTYQYRLGHDNGFANLCLVGDWTKNPLAVGCVEGAVIGAMHGIEPITGHLHIVK